jgi:hypothetical protein
VLSQLTCRHAAVARHCRSAQEKLLVELPRSEPEMPYKLTLLTLSVPSGFWVPLLGHIKHLCKSIHCAVQSAKSCLRGEHTLLKQAGPQMQGLLGLLE